MAGRKEQAKHFIRKNLKTAVIPIFKNPLETISYIGEFNLALAYPYALNTC